jgi:hypothetical protein
MRMPERGFTLIGKNWLCATGGITAHSALLRTT